MEFDTEDRKTPVLCLGLGVDFAFALDNNNNNKNNDKIPHLNLSKGTWLVDLVLLNKASILNFSLLVSLEVAQIYLSGWVGGVTVIIHYTASLISNWTGTGQLELSLAKIP